MNVRYIIFFLLIIFVLGICFLNYEKYVDFNEKNVVLVENIKLAEKRLEMIKNENIDMKKSVDKKEQKMKSLLKKIEESNVRDEGEFKKIVYVLARESGLQMKEISRSEKIWEKGDYELKYIHFTLRGSLTDFSKFMYLVNKSKKYIDTRKTYIELLDNSFRISLGFIEKNGEEM